MGDLAVKFHQTHHQRHCNTFPKTKFTAKFTNVANYRAHEWVGILYLLVILTQYNDGWVIINQALLSGGNENISNVLNVFEMILCFDAWINQTSFWRSLQNAIYIESANKSIKKMMKTIKRALLDTGRAQGWKNPKFHLLLYFVDMIVWFGAPKNYDTQCPEHNHKYFAKKPGF